MGKQLIKKRKLVGFKRPRIDIYKPVRKPKAPIPPNRTFETYKMNWANGTITVKATIDKYPAGDIVTYKLSVRKGGKLIERATYSESNVKDMMARIEELQAIPEE